MSKVIWFENKGYKLDPHFIVADAITDATIYSDEEGAEMSIGFTGNGSRWRAIQFENIAYAEFALQQIAKIITDTDNGHFVIGKHGYVARKLKRVPSMFFTRDEEKVECK